MDALLAELDPDLPLPYEDSAPPGLFTSVLRQLWGVVGGGSDSVFAEGSSEGELSLAGEDDGVVGSIGGEEEDETVDQSQHEMEVTVARLDPGQSVPIARLDPSAKPWCPTPTTATHVTSA